MKRRKYTVLIKMVVTNLLLLVIALLLVCLPVALSDQLKTQPTNGSSEIILQYEGNSQKIFGIFSHPPKYPLIVVVSNAIKFYNTNSESPLSIKENFTIKLGNFTFDKHQKALLEFKIVDATRLFFCTPNSCRICSIANRKCDPENSIKPNAKFNETLFTKLTRIETVLQLDNFNDIKTLKGSLVGPEKDRFVLRSVNQVGNGTQVYMLDTAVKNITRMATDLLRSSIGDFRVVTSFNDKWHTFFVGSAKRDFLPFHAATRNYGYKNKAPIRTDIRITRVCNEDQTVNFQSRIDLALPCGNYSFDSYKYTDGWNHTVIAARFSEGKLFVLFERSNSNKNPHVPLENVICEYSKGELDRAFDATWEECQNKRDKLDNLVLRCNDYEDQSTIIEDYCYIMSWYMLTHLNEGETGWVCKRYNNQYAVVPLDNCKLAEKITILDQYAWLENFRPHIEGTHVGSFKIETANAIDFVELGRVNEFALSLSDGSIRIVKRLSNGDVVPTWKIGDEISGNFSTVYLKDSNSLIYTEGNQLKQVVLDCAGLYKKCSDIFWEDQLKCGWCAFPNMTGRTMESESSCKAETGSFLRNICPPTVNGTKEISGEFTILGNNLSLLSTLHASLCDNPCDVTMHNLNVIELKCQKPITFSCHLELTANLGTTKGFKMDIDISNLQRKEAGSQTDDKSDEDHKTDNKAHEDHQTRLFEKYAIAVAVIVFLIIILVIIWGCYKKYYQRIRNNAINTEKNRERLINENSTELHFFGEPASDHYADCQIPMENLGLIGEMDRSKIQILRNIGNGNSSKVHLAKYFNGVREVEVAVKTVYNNQFFRLEDIIREIDLISKCQHRNIVQFVGYYRNPYGIHLVTEYMAGGDLHQFLIDETNKPTIQDAFLFIIQIAEGMEYLTKQHIIHRDLAARNCMLNAEQTVVKITDFGLCRQSNVDYEYVSENNNQQLPFRWTAIECFGSSRFSEKSDVWSFGVVVWEMFARNRLPYEGMDCRDVKEFITSGNRLESIEFCPPELYQRVMLKCWEENPSDRPSASELKREIERIYWDLRNNSPEYLGTEYETPISVTNNYAGTTTSDVTNLSATSTTVNTPEQNGKAFPDA